MRSRSSGVICEAGESAARSSDVNFRSVRTSLISARSKRRLIVEIDGSQHADQSCDEATRASYLASLGYRVLRFWNDQVLGSLGEVLDEIEKISEL
jgi:hypothetical protein